MTKMEYAQEIAKEIEGAKVEEITKNNGVIMTGIVVYNDNGVGATMYIDEIYEAGKSVEEGITIMQNVVKANKNVGFDVATLKDFNTVKDKLKCKLMNKKQNPDFTVTRSAKGYGFVDLIIVPYIEVEIGGQRGAAVVNERMIENWGVTKRTVIDRAIKNTEYVLMTLEEKLGLLGYQTEESPLLFVSTPNDGMNGAIAIIKAKERLAQIYPNGYYVIPSSVHEMLVLNMDYTDEDTITNMIRDVNANVLDPKDYLSDHAYVFNTVA